MKYMLVCLFFCLSIKAAPVIHDADQFRVYTFDENQSRSAELIFAVQQAYDAFEFYFNFKAEPLTVVAFPDASIMQQTDLDAFELRGKVLPFVIESLKDIKKDKQSSRLYPALGMKLSYKEGAWLVDELVDQLLMLNGLSGIIIGDEITQINSQSFTTKSDINKLIGQVKKGEELIVQVDRGSEKLIFKGRKLNLQTQQKKTTEPSTEPNQDKQRRSEIMLGALQHEIGHLLLLGVMNDKDQSSNKYPNTLQSYGSLKAPDWLDEMVANMCQGEAIKTIHRSSIKALSDLIPLTELLQMRHPSVDSILASKAYQDRIKKGSKSQTIILSSDDFSEAELEQITSKTGTFYGSSLLFGEYLYHQGGRHLLHQIIAITDAESEATFEIIIQRVPSLNNSIAAIEEGFHEYVALRLGIE